MEKGRLKSAFKVRKLFYPEGIYSSNGSKRKFGETQKCNYVPSFCTVYHNYNWVMTREKMNDTIKQPFFEWTNSNLSKSISRYIWEMQGRKVHISLFCNFEVGEEMCLKSTIFKCLDSEVQVPPPLKVIRKLVYIPPKLQLYFGLVQTNQKIPYHTHSF